MQHGLLYIPIHTHGFAVPSMLDTSTTWSFVHHKLIAKLPATIQTTMPLTVILPMGKIMVVTSAIQLDMLIYNFIYILYCYILYLANPLMLGNDFCISCKTTIDLA